MPETKKVASDPQPPDAPETPPTPETQPTPEAAKVEVVESDAADQNKPRDPDPVASQAAADEKKAKAAARAAAKDASVSSDAEKKMEEAEPYRGTASISPEDSPLNKDGYFGVDPIYQK